MSESHKPPIGSIGWVDLTVPDARAVRDFYKQVVGWQPEPVSMGDYNDYNMTDPQTGTPTSGICHQRGSNATMPAQWMIYITVADLDESMAACESLGGKVIVPPRPAGEGRFCVIEDPAGAVSALFERNV